MFTEALKVSGMNKKKSHQLSEYCPWIFMIEDGIVKLKDEALSSTYEFIAPDLASASFSKIAAVAASLNNCIIQLNGSWTIQFELQRRLSNEYPKSKSAVTLTAEMIEKQRMLNFSSTKRHYRNRYFLTFTYKLPSYLHQKSKNALFSSDKVIVQEYDISSELKEFKMVCENFVSVIETYMHIEKLNTDKLFSFLHSSVSLNWMENMKYPKDYALFMDNAITDTTLENSIPLKLGEYYCPIIKINDFPSETVPAMLDVLNKADCELRWSTRFSCLGKDEAIKRIEKTEKKYHGARKSIGQLVLETTMNISSGRENVAAAALEADTQSAKIDVSMGELGFGEYRSNVMVWSKELNVAEDFARYVSSLISSVGFPNHVEDLNPFPAFCCMMPGNIYANTYKNSLFVSTGNLSHVIPFSSIWSGLKENDFLGDISGVKIPHLVCDTEYGLLYYLNLNIRDVGHTWISGRTGAGKSTLLALLEIQWLKYPRSQVIIFDKGLSSRNLTMCTGGFYFEPGKDEITFQPLYDVDTKEGFSFAAEFIEILLSEQHIQVTPLMRNEIGKALKNVSECPVHARTLTSFCQYCQYQNPETHVNDINMGLSPYLLDGQYGNIFDSDHSDLELSPFWTMFEMDTLMNLGSAAVTPALDYLFHVCEKKFTGRPTLLVLDEAWLFLKNEIFAKKICEWLKVLRKKNVFVVFSTQELNDAINSPIGSTLVSQCVSKIYLADEEAETPMNKETYQKFGLEDSEIKALSRMRRKRDYFYKSSLGTRRFQLALDPLQLAILTSSTKEKELLDSIEERWGRNTGKELVTQILDAKHIDYSHLM